MALDTMTISILKLCRMAFSLMTLSLMTISIKILIITTLRIMSLNKMAFTILTISITALNLMTQSKTALSIMTLSIMVFGAMALCKMTLQIAAFSIMALSMSVHIGVKTHQLQLFNGCFINAASVSDFDHETLTEGEGSAWLTSSLMFCKKVNNVCNVKSSRAKPISTRKSTLLSLPI
jgi:hypothetical protein